VAAAAEVMPPFTDYSKAPQETNPNIVRAKRKHGLVAQMRQKNARPTQNMHWSTADFVRPHTGDSILREKNTIGVL
jgi:hypothetical protein